MAQWIGIGLAGVNRARRAPAHVHKKLRERWPFRRGTDTPDSDRQPETDSPENPAEE
jgi:hypothetical protein